MKLCENTLTVRSEHSCASGEVEEQAGRESGGLRLHSTMLKPNGQDATASEEVYESCVVRFSPGTMIQRMPQPPRGLFVAHKGPHLIDFRWVVF
jgi:hypothetical protein